MPVILMVVHIEKPEWTSCEITNQPPPRDDKIQEILNKMNAYL